MNGSPSLSLSLQEFITHSPIAIARLDGEGKILNANPVFHKLTHHIFESQSTTLYSALPVDDQAVLQIMMDRCMAGQSTDVMTLCIHLAEDRQIITRAYLSAMRGDDEKPVQILHLIDQTEQKNLELRFAHSQKMQAVGQLAGGVAHDFNNLLTAMIGFCDLLLMRHPAGDPSFADIMQVKQNANRAANLVRQLLAFSRRQTLQPKVLDMTDVLAELSNLVRRLIGENITLNMVHGRELGTVKADQGQLEQVMINLAVNARDAMPEGGTLSIFTSNAKITRAGPPLADLITPEVDEQITPGNYILVEVTDTGTGIPDHIIPNIFEPFFSTKEAGSGTGLGLSTVFGIVRQTGGYIYIKTAIDVGTSFYLYFPMHAEHNATPEQPVEEQKSVDLTGGETILLVEDETPVRIFAARALRNKGYKVLEADSGENAIEVYTQYEEPIDVIISDVIMPGMNGPKMIDKLEKEYPEKIAHTQVIFISGYAEDAFVDSFGPNREFNFLPKPFTLKQLAAKVKDVIEHRPGATEA